MNTSPQRRLYSLNQITVAAFLGSPFPGFWLASRNLYALGRQEKTRKCLAWGAGLTVGNFVLALILPERPPGPAFSFALYLFLVFATRSQSKEWFGPDLDAHVAAGGQTGSWWVSILAGVAAQVILTISFALVLLLESKT
jgi:hypothetical protein